MQFLTLVLLLLTLPMGLSSKEYRVRKYCYDALKGAGDVVDTRPWLLWASFRAVDEQGLRSLRELYRDYETIAFPDGPYPPVNVFFDHANDSYSFWTGARNYFTAFWDTDSMPSCVYSVVEKEFYSQASIDYVSDLFRRGWTRGRVRSLLEKVVKKPIEYREPEMPYPK